MKKFCESWREQAIEIGIVEKILDNNKQQKSKGLKILTPKQTFRRLPIALAQVKAGITFEILLKKIHQIMYSLYILSI